MKKEAIQKEFEYNSFDFHLSSKSIIAIVLFSCACGIGLITFAVVLYYRQLDAQKEKEDLLESRKQQESKDKEWRTAGGES